MGCYLDPDNVSTIESIVLSTSHIHRRVALLVADNFNANLCAAEENRHEEEITVAMVNISLDDMATNFLLSQKILGAGQEDEVNAPEGKGCTFPDELYSRNELPSITECIHPRPPSQL